METKDSIPTEVYLDFVGRTIPIHWEYHAILMVTLWFVIVPIGIVSVRYFKPRPTKEGIKIYRTFDRREWAWFHVHLFGLYSAVLLSVAGVAFALVVSRGFSGSVHSYFGLATVALGVLQLVSAHLRGTHGGRYYNNADPNDPRSWAGDHFNMTRRRRRFEAYHKTAGYFAGFCAVGAVASGFMQFPMQKLMTIVILGGILLLIVCIYREYLGTRYDTYRSVFGNDPDHPYNRKRDGL